MERQVTSQTALRRIASGRWLYVHAPMDGSDEMVDVRVSLEESLNLLDYAKRKNFALIADLQEGRIFLRLRKD